MLLRLYTLLKVSPPLAPNRLLRQAFIPVEKRFYRFCFFVLLKTKHVYNTHDKEQHSHNRFDNFCEFFCIDITEKNRG